MDTISKQQRDIGINFDEGKQASVRFWAPAAKSVQLKTERETIALEKSDFGYWVTRTDRIAAGDIYRFVLDDEVEVADPASLLQADGVHGPSVACDLNAFAWQDQKWENPSLSTYIFYELHTGTFTAEGNFSGIMDRLDYLVELGITAIELMPVAQFPGERNWGYDGVFPFAVQNSYGGPEGLQELVNACHQKGLAVVLDVVYNHVGPEGNYFDLSGPYFTEKYKTPWGSAVNFDDAWSDGVRNYFIANVLMWFRDFHIDALRMDAVHAIKDFGAVHFLQQLRKEVDALMHVSGRTHYLIIESDLNDQKYINPLQKNGYGMDATWIDEFHHALRVTAGEPQTGYYADFSGIMHLEKAYRDAYVYDGIYSPHRLKVFGGKAEGNEGQQFVVFSQNHDQVGNRMLGERSSMLFSYEMQKLMAAAVVFSPFLPMLFMGEEWGETNPFQFFISHGEPGLIAAVRKGRKAEFAAFHNDGEAPDPQDENTFLQSRLQWDLREKDGHQQLLAYYRALLRLRKQYGVLGTNRKQMQVSADEETNCLLLQRWDADQHLVCLMNFSSISRPMVMPELMPRWEKIFDSADPGWKGPVTAPRSVNASDIITVQPESILVYASSHV